jgi:hypothetical protein
MSELPFIAYRTSVNPIVDLVPAPLQRTWMAETHDGFAHRCLPLLIANQAGWWVTVPQTLSVEWNGGPALPDTRVVLEEGDPPAAAASHFGHGIVTFTIPYLFRTPPGWNLLVRGPANWPKDGASPLEGIVETDWCPATFTMNWQVTRPAHAVRFERGEPIAMLVPTRRGDLEACAPELRELHQDKDVSTEYRAWRQSRAAFLEDLHLPGTAAREERWQKDYMLGLRPDGSEAPEHQRKLSLRAFRRAPR